MLNKHLLLFDNELNWLSTLMNIIKGKLLIKFVVNLDQIYQGLETYLDLSEMPGILITNVLVKNHEAHEKFQRKSVSNTFSEMAFFRISALAKVNGKTGFIWDPTKESLKSFSLKHTDKEVIFFEDKHYKETVQFFQRQFGKLLPDG